jgi:Na+-translocating ferredoxin:NAD+ oxidoreductase RnfG subunit
MFEDSEEVEKSTAPKGMWVGLAVVAVILIAGAYFFFRSKGVLGKQASAQSSAAMQAQIKDADAVRDLKVQRATMNKDRTGTTAVWLVSIENKSASYTYSNIQYETTYVGANNDAILINKGTIPATIQPGEQKSSEINDALYPAGTAWYKIRITGATASVQ